MERRYHEMHSASKGTVAWEMNKWGHTVTNRVPLKNQVLHILV